MNAEVLRNEFPMLVAGDKESKPLAFLDSTATTQKPASVIDAMDDFYREHYSSVKRGVYRLSARTTEAFEKTRKDVAKFINAKSEDEIVFTRGTTESINLVAWSYGRKFFEAGDEILISGLEHHATVRKLAPQAKILIDAAQSSSHIKIDVQKLDCDFLAFSGHKMYGPTGIGVLYGKYDVLDSMPPWHGGGEMIKNVTFEKTTYADVPARFEAGTPAIAEVIGLGKAIEWLNNVGLDNIRKHEEQITQYALQQLAEIPQRIEAARRNPASESPRQPEGTRSAYQHYVGRNCRR